MIEICYLMGMEATACSACGMPKGLLTCGACQSPVCKKCAQSLKKDSFAFLQPTPEVLTHKTYCARCFNDHVDPALTSYTQLMERAKAIIVFHRGQGEETRLMKRSEKPIKVVDCADRAETLLRLAFHAAQADFNALVDVEISAVKVRNEGYQTSAFQGTGIPTQVDAEKLEREEKRRLLKP